MYIVKYLAKLLTFNDKHLRKLILYLNLYLCVPFLKYYYIIINSKYFVNINQFL